MDLVSVILPTYNRGYCISKSIESVLNQSYNELELIVVDDGSTDETENIVSTYVDKKQRRVRYIKLEKNAGVCNARNIGIKYAEGTYIAFQDSDDFWMPEKLEKQMDAIKNANADYSYTYIEYMLNGEKVIVPPEEVPLENLSGNVYHKILERNTIGAPTLVMARYCYEKIGGFDEIFPAIEDYDYALRLSREFQGIFVPEVLLKATFSLQGVSQASLNYLVGHCILVGRYKRDLLEDSLFDEKVEWIYKEAMKVYETQLKNVEL